METQAIKIDKEFDELCWPLTAEELSLLEAQLEEEGCLCPLIIWAGHDILLDGHNRKRICDQLGIPYETKEIVLANRDQAFDWIVTHQLGKRNAGEDQKSYLRGKRYRHEKKSHGGDRKSEESRGNEFPMIRTAEKLASEYGVSDKTIKNDAKFSEAVDAIAEVAPEAKTAILSGTQKIKRKDVQRVAALPKPERKAAAKKLMEPKEKPAKEKAVRKTTSPKKEANWPQMLKWASKQRKVTKESLVKEFPCNVDDIRKKLATVNQSTGYIVKNLSDGEYIVRKAVHFAHEKGGEGQEAALQHLKESAEEALRLINSDSSIRWTQHDQSMFVSEVLEFVKAFSKG